MLAIPVLAVACAITALVATGTLPEGEPTSYAGASGAADTADALAGLGLVLSGALAWTRARTRTLGLLAMLAGLAWLGPNWEGWEGAPSLVRSLGAVVSLFFLPLLLHLALAVPTGRVGTRAARVAVGAAYALAGAAGIGLALFRDPLLDPYCWRTCSENAFLAHADPGLASTLGDAWNWSAVVIGVAVVAIGVRRLIAATSPARRVLVPTLVPVVLVAAAEVVYAVALLHDPLEDPGKAGFAAVFYARSLSAFALALGVAWSVLHMQRIRSSVASLAADVAEAPPAGTLRDGLAAALGDPGLEVHYWLPGSGRFVTADGTAASPPAPGNGLAVTPITRAGRTLAVVSHDAALLDGDELERQIGSAARLAIDNERLQAEVLAQLADLRSSRARIVEAGDAERRRLERNLHDGAQQRLLAVSYDLRLARAAADSGGDPELSALSSRATEEIDGALGELRELAEGIYPATLTEAGLGTALESLADAAPIPVELGEVAPGRYPAAAETTAFYTVQEAVHDAAVRGATFARVATSTAEDILVVTVEDDGAGRDGPLVHVADRVGALGGSVDARPTTIRAELPCA
ncbi:MAG TPA: histidine kinase [Thermoleophilaceae bacterium]|nr:histidine kinase [Thermoleophilaceae bacterium]